MGQVETKPIEISISSGPVYIGKSTLHDTLEKIYGTKFNLNTIFFRIIFKEDEKLYKDNGDLVPDYIPHDYIKSLNEDTLFDLTMNGTVYKICCKQQRRMNP